MDSGEKIKIGDKVRCIDKHDFYYNFEGVVTVIYSENYLIVEYRGFGGKYVTCVMNVNSLELIYEEEIEWVAEKR